MPVSFGLLEGLDYHGLVGPLDKQPLIREVYGGLKALNQRVLFRHPSRGELIGLSS